MIEAGMFFALGLATAGLLALMIAPLLWRRAVRLTRARIEHAVPLTLAEIQADKDQLRAEFAMSARRLEASVERLRQKAADQLAEIEGKRETIRRLAEEQARRIEAVEKLQVRDTELQRQLQRREERLAEANAELSTLRIGLTEHGRALEEVELTLRRARQDNEEKTVELVARDTEIDNLRDEVSAARARHTAVNVEKTRLETELAEARTSHAAAEQKAASMDERVARLETDRTARLAEIDARETEIARLRGELEMRGVALDGIERRLADAEAAHVEAQAQISRLTLRLEAESRRPPSGEAAAALAGLEAERDELTAELAVLQEAHDRLVAENAELITVAGKDWEAERVENALLRERLNDVATEVARLAQSYRGDTGLAELAALAGRDDKDRPDEPTPGTGRSLADRIRAMQRNAG